MTRSALEFTQGTQTLYNVRVLSGSQGDGEALLTTPSCDTLPNGFPQRDMFVMGWKFPKAKL